MAIAFDNATDLGSASGVSPTLTAAHLTTGQSLALFVITSDSTAPDHITGVTYNGVAMTNNGSLTSAYEGTAYNARLWYLFGPSAGNHNVVVSSSSAAPTTVYAVAASYTGAFATAVDNQTTGTLTASSPFSLTLTPNADECWVLMGGNNALGSSTAGTGTTNRVSTASGMWVCDNNAAISPAAATTLNEVRVGNSWSGVMISFAPGTQKLFDAIMLAND